MKGRYVKHIVWTGLFTYMACLMACSPSQNNTLSFTQQPTVQSVKDYPAQPVLAVSFAANQQANVSYRLETQDFAKDLQALPAHKADTRLVLGLAPGVSNFYVKLTNKFGDSQTSKAIDIPAAEAALLPFDVMLRPQPEALWQAANYLVLSVYRDTDTGPQAVLLALDNRGRVSWVLPIKEPVSAIAQTTANSLTLVSNTGLEQLNVLGQPLQFLSGQQQSMPQTSISRRVNASYLLKPARKADNKSLFIVEPEWRLLTVNNHEQRILGANIVELNHKGDINQRWSLFDLLDTSRWGEVLKQADVSVFPAIATELWASIDQLILHPDNKQLLVEVGQQNIIASINRKTGQLNWLLGDTADWATAWQKRWLRAIDNTVLPIKPALLQTYTNGDLLLVDSSHKTLGRYQIDRQQQTLRSVWVQPLESSMIAALQADKLEFIALSDQQLLLIDKATGSINTLATLAKQHTSPQQWLTLVASDKQGPWHISAVAHGINLQAPKQPAPIFTSHIPAVHSTENTVKTGEDGLSGADLRGEPQDMSGHWQLHIAQDSAANPHTLELQQHLNIASGHFAGEPVQAYVKGNVITFTLRNTGNNQSLVRRFRAVILPERNRLQGRVDLFINNEVVAQSTWWADRLTTMTP